MLNILKYTCVDRQLNFSPSLIMVDFETAMHNAIRQALPQTSVRCCRFHFGQALWRRDLGLTTTYEDRTSADSKWLHRFFGLPLLPAHLVESTFSDYLMAEAPTSEQMLQFADYVLKTFIASDTMFPPLTWAWPPDNVGTPHTNNAAESFHGRLSAYFDRPHPNIFVFVNGLKDIQSGVYITLRSLHQLTKVSSEELKRRQFAFELYQKLVSGEISTENYVHTICYSYLPVA